jgi:DNA-binding winged helix-turn-helix (wHTH) protein/tetratricopeptide (TPR) repeat protein
VKQFYDFPPFSIDVSDRILLRGRKPVAITPKAFDVLLPLVQRHGQIVSKETLFQEAWPNTSVSETNLQQQILTARRVLGQVGDEYIQNVPKRGYRFAARVVERTERVRAPKSPLPGRKLRRWVLILITIWAALALLSLVWFFWFRHPRGPHTPRKAIAVLDFRDLREHPDDRWLSSALPELLRSELSVGGRLRTASSGDISRLAAELRERNALQVNSNLLSKVRNELGSDFVLSGSYVCQGTGPDRKIRVDLTVVDTRTGEIVTSLIEADVMSRLLDLVGHLGATLRGRLGDHELAVSDVSRLRALQPSSTEVERVYAEGMQKLRMSDTKGAQQCFERVTELDSDYAAGHLQLANAWAVLGYQTNARKEAKSAYERSKNLPREDALWIEARYRELSHDWGRAVEVYRSLWTFYPDNIDYGLALANAQVATLNPDAALKTLARMRQLSTVPSDDPRVDLAEASAFEALGDFKRELNAAQRTNIKAERQHSSSLAASALLKEAWSFYNLGDFEQATKIAVEARRVYSDLKDPGGEAAATKSIGDIQSDSGKLDEALKNYNAALSAFRNMGHQGRVAMTLNNMAYVFKDKGDLGGAQHLFEEAASLGQKIGDQNVHAMGLNGMAIVLWRQGQISLAKEKYEAAYSTFKEAGDRSHAAVTLNNLAIALQDLGNLDEARQDFKRCLREYRDIGDKLSTARELGNLGELLTKQGDLTHAKTYLEEQQRIAQTMPDDKQLAYAVFGLGAIALAQGDVKTARQRFEQSLEIRKNLNEKGLMAESETGVAQALLESGQYDNAQRAARDAAAEFNREKEVDEEAGAWSIASTSLLREGKRDDAARAADAAMKLGGSSQDRETRFSVRIAAARAYAATGQASRALQYVNEVCTDSEKLGYVSVAFDAELTRAEIEAGSQPNKANLELQQLERQAKEKGFQLISRKAAIFRLVMEGRHAN